MLRRVLTIDEKKIIENLLATHYGIIDGLQKYVIIVGGENRVRITHKEVLEFSWRLKNVVNMGLYIAKLTDDGISLSIEGAQFFSDKITKNIIEVDLSGAERWMQGMPLKIERPTESRYVVVKFGDVFLGSGRIGREGFAYPQISKNRLTRQSLDSGKNP